MHYIFRPVAEGELSNPIMSKADRCHWVVAGKPRKTLRAAIAFAKRVGGYVQKEGRIVWMNGVTFA